MSYFTPACNSNRRSQPQSNSYPTSSPQPPSGGGYTQSPAPMKRGGFIPPPVGAMQASGQTIQQCPRCRELLPPGKDHYVHLLGCGVAEVLTKGFTPYEYPPRQNHTRHPPLPNIPGGVRR